MTHVLVVSRNAALGMWLSRNGLDIDEVRPDGSDTWTHDVPGHDAVLLDVGTAEQAELRLKALVSAGLRVPVLLVGDDHSTEWATLAGRFCSGLALLPLPLNPAVVLEHLGALMAGPQLDTYVSRRAEEMAEQQAVVEEVVAFEQLVEQAAAVERALPEVTPIPDAPTPLFDVVAHEVALAETAVASPTDIVHPSPPLELPEMRELVHAGEALTTTATTTTSPATAEPVISPPVDLPETPAPTVSPPAHPPAVPVAAQPQKRSAAAAPEGASLLQLVAALQSRAAGLYSVYDVAEFILEEMVQRCHADAGAALMRSGDVWVVEAGVGLRTLESRLAVPSEHWLVRRVVEQKLGLLVTRSDGSGHELLGAPLASWEHLAGVYLPQGQLLVLLASADHAFDESHLTTVRSFDEESRELLHEACAVRDLARVLRRFAGDPGESYST